MNSRSRIERKHKTPKVKLIYYILNTRLNVNLVTESTTQVLCDTGGGTCSSRSASKYFNGT